MKLYAVTIKAGLIINGAAYARERNVPISKFAYLAPAQQLTIGYSPAVFTSKTNAFKLIKKLPLHLRDQYEIVKFDSGWVDYPEVV